jgi:hypothetical protein
MFLVKSDPDNNEDEGEQHQRLLHIAEDQIDRAAAEGLDGEEIETGCELKGLALRRTYGNTLPAFRRCGDFAD